MIKSKVTIALIIILSGLVIQLLFDKKEVNAINIVGFIVLIVLAVVVEYRERIK